MTKQTLSPASQDPVSQVNPTTQCDIPSRERTGLIWEPEEMPLSSSDPSNGNPEKRPRYGAKG
ncbi:hypothetical protein A2U01_0089872, partial [Trifolium medium]|nr:hypothetical protein [Trifolium medium]